MSRAHAVDRTWNWINFLLYCVRSSYATLLSSPYACPRGSTNYPSTQQELMRSCYFNNQFYFFYVIMFMSIISIYSVPSTPSCIPYSTFKQVHNIDSYNQRKKRSLTYERTIIIYKNLISQFKRLRFLFICQTYSV